MNSDLALVFARCRGKIYGVLVVLFAREQRSGRNVTSGLWWSLGECGWVVSGVVGIRYMETI